MFVWIFFVLVGVGKRSLKRYSGSGKRELTENKNQKFNREAIDNLYRNHPGDEFQIIDGPKGDPIITVEGFRYRMRLAQSSMFGDQRCRLWCQLNNGRVLCKARGYYWKKLNKVVIEHGTHICSQVAAKSNCEKMAEKGPMMSLENLF